MGKPTGFMNYERRAPVYKPADERIHNYEEFVILQPTEEIQTQGARCMDCGIPFCHAMGCPVYNLIPEWNDLVYRGKWEEAYYRLEMTNTLPEVTGRICPAPCEAACTLSINTSPVTIKQIELAIIERAFKEGWVVPRPPSVETGKKVAVIGSGPAGLAAVQQLRRAGHTVTLFEKDNKIGGILRYGIPDYKLDKSMLDRRIEQMSAEGVTFETDVVIGEDISVRYLRKSFDAILLTIGAGTPRDLHVPGRGLEGIHFAMDYLKQSNKAVAGELEKHQIISAKNKNVLVIGGGDTGADCVGTAIRQGARQVYQYEIMPKPMTWDKPWNPSWPNWPRIFRTATSHEEGCTREWGILTKGFRSHGINIEEADFVRVKWEKDEKKNRQVMKEIPGSEFSLKVDLVLLAMGFLHVEHGKLIEDLGIDLDDRGNLKIENYATTVPGVFAAGDSGTGASLVVRAIYHGREAAKSIDEFLRK
ncbi:MAG: glutamate synthase small subunit [Chitinivibrionales bacterium]|nr:glutamate synthase small subunit [Chitinivibrionales bacterium]